MRVDRYEPLSTAILHFLWHGGGTTDSGIDPQAQNIAQRGIDGVEIRARKDSELASEKTLLGRPQSAGAQNRRSEKTGRLPIAERYVTNAGSLDPCRGCW